MGSWIMPKLSNFVTGMKLERWGVLCLARVDDATWGAFERELMQEGRRCGITVQSSGDNYIESRADYRLGYIGYSDTVPCHCPICNGNTYIAEGRLTVTQKAAH